ncbi:MAG: hypothetical protein HFE94_06420 [Acutalibacter sp.]|nr:hypothetical protein [Acutalibacter sp.]
MKKRIFYLQLVAIGLIILGVAGLGVILFRRDQTNMTALYVFAGLGIVGFIGNAVLAVFRLLLERDGKS